MNFHLKFLSANLRGGKGSTFMVGPGRHLASLRHWAYVFIPMHAFTNFNRCITVYLEIYFVGKFYYNNSFSYLITESSLLVASTLIDHFRTYTAA